MRVHWMQMRLLFSSSHAKALLYYYHLYVYDTLYNFVLQCLPKQNAYELDQISL